MTDKPTLEEAVAASIRAYYFDGWDSECDLTVTVRGTQLCEDLAEIVAYTVRVYSETILKLWD